MRRRDGGNDGAMRSHHIDQSGDFTGMIHTQFKDAIFGILRQARQRERYADMIIEAALGSMGFARFGQRISKAGFCSGFADTAGNGNDLRGTAFARGTRQAFQSSQNIGDRQHHCVFFQTGRVKICADQSRRRAIFESLRDIIMAMCPFTRQGDENITGQ